MADVLWGRRTGLGVEVAGNVVDQRLEGMKTATGEGGGISSRQSRDASLCSNPCTICRCSMTHSRFIRTLRMSYTDQQNHLLYA